jgi:phospholipid-binding lipoprotein MlaA
MKSQTRNTAVCLLAAATFLSGCAAGPTKSDPLEPFNRSMFEVNEVLDKAVAKPVAETYVKIIPDPIRHGVANFFGNIDDLYSGINNLLQGKRERAGDDFGRVLLNSTFGFLGFLDLATLAGIEKDHQDFGLTFAHWGIPNGPYLFVPIFGPSTFRDGSGFLIRAFTTPTGFIPNVPLRNSVWGTAFVNERAELLGSGSVLDTASIDKYRFLRDAYLRARRYQAYDGKPPPDDEDAQ